MQKHFRTEAIRVVFQAQRSWRPQVPTTALTFGA